MRKFNVRFEDRELTVYADPDYDCECGPPCELLAVNIAEVYHGQLKLEQIPDGLEKIIEELLEEELA